MPPHANDDQRPLARVWYCNLAMQENQCRPRRHDHSLVVTNYVQCFTYHRGDGEEWYECFASPHDCAARSAAVEDSSGSSDVSLCVVWR